MLKSDPESVQDLVNDLKDNLYDYLLYLKSPTGPIESMEDALENQKSSLEERIEDMQKLIMEQVEMFRQQLIQIQLLQEEMESLKAQLTSVFGTTTLLPQ
jgi:flagellar hook-associated protein 2